MFKPASFIDLSCLAMALHLRYHHKISKNRAPSFVFVSKVQIHRTEHLCPEGTKGLQRVHAGAYSAGESATTVPTATTDVATADGTGCLKPHINLQAAPSTVPWKSAAATGWGYSCKISTEQLQALLTAGPCGMGGLKGGRWCGEVKRHNTSRKKPRRRTARHGEHLNAFDKFCLSR